MSRGKKAKASRHSRAAEARVPSGALAGKPVVAIVGRPNVGKSSLFNRLAGGKIAIVEDVPGVTRDRLYADAMALGRELVLVDTGGFDPESDDPMAQSIAEQVRAALTEADVVVFVVDGTVDPLPADREAARLLRGADVPVIFAANKIDSERKSRQAYVYYELGLDPLLHVSAAHGHGMGDLEEAIADALPPEESQPQLPPEVSRIAVIGRPNAGKSSLVNRMLGQARHVVDDRPGTTVDSVDAWVEWKGTPYVLIDTAGIRRKRSVRESVESLAVFQAIRSIERSDVVVLLVDAERGAAEQDAKIAGLALDRGRALVIALNKIDLLNGEAQKEALRHTRDVLSFVPWAPLCKLSVKTGRGMDGVMEAVQRCAQSHAQRVSTGEVNRFFEDVIEHHPPPTQGSRAARIYYITQAQTRPPTFVAVTNDPSLVHFSYRRYIVNRLRERFGFQGTPVRLFFRKRSKSGSR